MLIHVLICVSSCVDSYVSDSTSTDEYWFDIVQIELKMSLPYRLLPEFHSTKRVENATVTVTVNTKIHG